MEPGCPGLRRNHLPERWCGQKGGQAAGGQMCFPLVTPQASKKPQHLSLLLKEGAHGASAGTAMNTGLPRAAEQLLLPSLEKLPFQRR